MSRASMRGTSLLIALLAWAGAAPGASPAATEEASLRESERRGVELYRADRTAWLTTDLMQDQGLVRRNGKLARRIDGKPRGWITAPTEAADVWRVAYLSEVKKNVVAFADGTVDFSATPLASLRENSPARALDAAESTQLRFRNDAMEREWLACASPYNVAGLPEADGGWTIYLLTPQQKDGVYPLGGFHRFRYDAEGNLLEQYAHTRSCLSQDMNNAPGKAVFAAMVSHLTSELPNEFHVFMSLSYGMPVYVVTPDGRLWKVENGKIEPVDKDSPEE